MTSTVTLSFSRVIPSTLTLVGGNVNVNPGGTLDMGTSGSPIAAVNATLILSSGTFEGQYYLAIFDGGNFTVYGASKTPAATASADALIGAGAVALIDTGNMNWSVGDVITIGKTSSGDRR